MTISSSRNGQSSTPSSRRTEDINTSKRKQSTEEAASYGKKSSSITPKTSEQINKTKTHDNTGNTENTTRNNKETHNGLKNNSDDYNPIYMEMNRMFILSFCDIFPKDEFNNTFNVQDFKRVQVLNWVQHSTVLRYLYIRLQLDKSVLDMRLRLPPTIKSSRSCLSMLEATSSAFLVPWKILLLSTRIVFQL